MYTMKNKEILRDGVPVATVNDGNLDFLEGMAKFRAPAVRFYNSLKDEPNEPDNDLDTDKPDDVVEADTTAKTAMDADTEPPKEEEKEEEVEGEKSWLDVLSGIVGVSLPIPHPKHGWRGTHLRPVLLKNYNNIVNSKEIDNSIKKQIINYFM